MNNVNRTMYIPLYGKALVSRMGIILKDEKAAQIWQTAGFPMKGKSASKWLAYYMAMRAAVFDDWVRQQLSKNPDAWVFHLGCGLDSRNLRVVSGCRYWFDVDFPAVITERKKYFLESDTYHMIPCDVRDAAWLESVTKGKHAIVVMEGISMYLRFAELQNIMAALSRSFDRIVLLMDCYSGFAAKASRFKNPVNEVGVREVWGVDDPDLLAQGTGLCFAGEKDMSPPELVAQLSGGEQKVYRHLYAGKMARKLYRLYEFRK